MSCILLVLHGETIATPSVCEILRTSGVAKRPRSKNFSAVFIFHIRPAVARGKSALCRQSVLPIRVQFGESP